MTLRLTVAPPDLVVSATLVAVTVTDWELVMLAGAVYSPVAEILPTLGLIDQVTAVFVVPVAPAVNCGPAPAIPRRVRGAGHRGRELLGLARSQRHAGRAHRNTDDAEVDGGAARLGGIRHAGGGD